MLWNRGYGIDNASLNSMEMFHSKNAKLFQQLPPNTCNIGSVATIGWNSVKAQIDIRRLLFLWQILLLPMSTIYKKVMLYLILNPRSADRRSGPLCKMLVTCAKYGLSNMVVNSVVNGTYMSMPMWKRMVKRMVIDQDNRDLHKSSYMYESLSHAMSHVLNHKMTSWWTYAHRYPRDTYKCSTIVRLLLNSYRLGANRCAMCNEASDTLSHILFSCWLTADLRNALWNHVLDECSPKLASQMIQMPIDSRTRFITNALNCDYTADWTNVYCAILLFINTTFHNYQNA